ncbi:UDP-3-O-(3-hydroxymyristoyl)glucosamine N-acyltransferase [Alphaproteobacteria bacterium]|nr:UDP-3-O-(3-hydroxymyristoyl)glucosamine N-acyltransferase [Alphaproteobacteria bacterium]
MIDFDRSKFFPLKNIFNCNDIKKLLKNYLIDGNIDNNFEILDISSFNNIKNNSIFFLFNESNFSLDNSDTILVITYNKKIYDSVNAKNKFLINNQIEVYNLILNKIFIHDDSLEYKDDFEFKSGSYISKFAKIDESSIIRENCIIGRGVMIGKNVIVKNNTVIKNAIVSDNSIICENSTIGSTGFGFDLKNMGSVNISPQIGIVYIGKNVLVGSNCSIDRGKIDHTIIGDNSMLDNLIHIAHNVVLGKNTCIAAQTGISGSVTIGDNVIIGGQAGFAGHIKIGKNVIVAAKSGVTKNIKNNSVIAGFPAIDIKEWKKNIINQKKNGHK